MTQALSHPPDELSDADVAALLTRIDARLARLEAVTAQAPAVIATATDVADDVVRHLQARGVDLDERARLSLDLIEQLTDPARIQALERAIALTDQLEPTVATTVDIVDSVIARVQARGVDLDARGKDALELVELLTEPERMAKLRQAIELADQLEPTLAATADIVDGVIARMQARGVDLDERARLIARLTEKLTAPDRLEKIERLVDMSDELEPTLLTLIDIVDSALVGLSDRGVSLDERARALLEVTRLATEPEVLDIAQRMLRRTDILNDLAHLAEGAPDMVAMGIDIFDSWIARSIERGMDASAIGQSLATATGRFLRLLQDDSFEKFVNSGILDPGALDVVGRAAQALADTLAEGEPEELGPWKTFRSLGNSHIRRAVGFGVSFGKRFGQMLRPQLPA